ncbi:MAG: hypothetical protein AAGA96_11815 [Verrucomicrobiota bacterium]
MAKATGAPVVPVFPELTREGSVRLEILPPLPETGDALSRALGRLLAERWPSLVGQVEWRMLEQFESFERV